MELLLIICANKKNLNEWRKVKLSGEHLTFDWKKQRRKTKHSEIEPLSKVILLESEVSSNQRMKNSTISTDNSEDSNVFHNYNHRDYKFNTSFGVILTSCFEILEPSQKFWSHYM